jgi:hypothetical protein
MQFDKTAACKWRLKPKRYPENSRLSKKICKPKLPQMLASTCTLPHRPHRMQHFLFFFFLSASLVDGGSSAATIAYICVSQCTCRMSSEIYLIKHVFELVLRQSRALDVLDCTKFACHSLAVLALDRRHSLLRQLIFHGGVFPQIHLCTNDQAWHPRAVVVYLGEPLFTDVLEGCGRGYGEAYEEHVGLGV